MRLSRRPGARGRPPALLVLLVACAQVPEVSEPLPDPVAPDPSSCPAVSRAVAECPVTLSYIGKGSSVTVAGEWNGFSKSAQPLAPDGPGRFRAVFRLKPGLHAYKIVVDDEWRLDPQSPYRKYVGGIENSGLRVPECGRPSLRAEAVEISRAAMGRGSLRARILATPGLSGDAICGVRGTLRHPDDHAGPGYRPRALTAQELRPDGTGAYRLSLDGLPDGKYTVRLQATSPDGESEALLLPFWVEERPFSMTDSPLYMIVTDRFADGDPATNPARLPGVPPSADYHGGDLDGVTDKIRAGYFDERGIRTLWLTPFYTQPDGSYLDQSGRYQVAAYHGYWPVRARAVDPRIGGAAALHRLVEEAHRHGMRVLMDAVLNHVHEEHEYLRDPEKAGWFRMGCVCGTPGCDFTEKRLSCVFATYMPDIDWTVTEASERFIEDTLFWLEEFDLDGLRIDAVKHVEDLAIWNLGARVRERFEQAGTHYPLIGETAMGWQDASVEKNRENYETIKRYIGPGGLSGQFDFVWYHAVPYRVFAWDERGLPHLDYWTHASLAQFHGADMVNYLGSHDTSRFVTLSTYRGQSPAFSRDRAFNKWQDLPLGPEDDEPYDRLWLAMLNLVTTPGVPLIYYGDEYGEPGGGDPDNRHDMRFSGLSAREAAQDLRMKALFRARARLAGLSRGDLLTLFVDEELYAYARPDAQPRGSALVLLNRARLERTLPLLLPPELGWPEGAALLDYLSGTEHRVGMGSVMVTVPARGGVVLGLK